jgi:hypothetical protein
MMPILKITNRELEYQYYLRLGRGAGMEPLAEGVVPTPVMFQARCATLY